MRPNPWSCGRWARMNSRWTRKTCSSSLRMTLRATSAVSSSTRGEPRASSSSASSAEARNRAASMPELRAEMIDPERGRAGAQQYAGENQANDDEHKPFLRTVPGQSARGRERFWGLGRRESRGVGLLRKRHIGKLRRTNETVAAAGDCFDIRRLFGGFAERLAKLVHRGVDVGVVVDVGVGRPQGLFELIAGDHFSLIVNQHQQHLIDLALQTEL